VNHYGVLYPGFWGGETGRRIAELGGASAQLVALYLTANPAATMLGLYPLEPIVMRAQIGTLTPGAIVTAIEALEQAQFATFDAGTNHVWVHEMAKFRLGLHLKPLKADDNRVTHVRRMYAGLRPNPFLGDFFKRYRKELHLTLRRDFDGARKALRRGSEGASKPVTGSVTGTEITKQDQKSDQDQVDQKQRAVARPSHAVLVRLAHDVLTFVEAGAQHPDHPDLGAMTLANEQQAELLKRLAAKAQLVYDGRSVTKALDAARAQRQRRRAS
jgi:hypothetical protein